MAQASVNLRCAVQAHVGRVGGSLDGWRGAAVLVASGCGVLALGVLVYLTDRAASQAALIPSIGWLAGGTLFGALGQWLPSFAHTFAFSLFTAVALPPRPTPRYGACVVWGAVNVAFEVGQHELVSAHLADVLQAVSADSFVGTTLTRALARYFTHGTFDIGDIAATLLGALVAGAALSLVPRHREHNHAR